MFDPERVLRMAYLPGEKVRVELGFRWEGEVSAVSGHFRRFVGSRYCARHLEPGISLVGNFQIPDRGWVLVFENLHLSISVVGGPPGHREREGERLFGVSFLD